MANLLPAAKVTPSVETILTRRTIASEWSQQLSTTTVPGMDMARGTGVQHPRDGRRRLSLGSLALGSFLAMHCHVAAAAVSDDVITFILTLVVATALLGNPMRHFEVYLGEWSLHGPGRAFHIIPMLDGIGIAICINSIFRAILSSTMAAIAIIYFVHSISDAKLPYTYCRDFNLSTYEPIKIPGIAALRMGHVSKSKTSRDEKEIQNTEEVTVGTKEFAWRDAASLRSAKTSKYRSRMMNTSFPGCNEVYKDKYPVLFQTPHYNYFYVEVARLREDYSFRSFNLPLIVTTMGVWLFMWSILVSEHFRYGRLIWNNVYAWLFLVPWAWVVALMVAAAYNMPSYKVALRLLAFDFGLDHLRAISAALEVSLYIHSASIGTELILGKGLNHYASGHIDPSLNGENVFHSCAVAAIALLQCAGAALCSTADTPNAHSVVYSSMGISSLWILPMYSKCVIAGNYSHLISALIFGGLIMSYVTVAFLLIKAALHTIFEYRVKLVFIEHVVVGMVMVTCMALSIVFTTNGGIMLLEAMSAVVEGVCIPFVCLLELVALLYVYRGHDFISDMNVATEDNTCSTRLSLQWRTLPYITALTLVGRVVCLCFAEMAPWAMTVSAVPVVAIALAVPLRAAHNAIVFLSRRRKT